MTSQEYTKWLEGFLEALSHVRLDHKELAIALSKIEDKLMDVVDHKQLTNQIPGVPNTPPIPAPHYSGTPFNNPFTVSTTNTNMTI